MTDLTHLTNDQIAELVSASPRELSAAAPESDLARGQAHASACAECAAEIARLREAVSLFREAGTAFAEANLPRVIPFRQPARRFAALQPAYWAAAAAAVFLAALLPMQTAFHHAHSATAHTPVASVTQPVVQHASESDEALLDDVNRELSESVPSPMRALADPTGSSTSSSQNSTQRTN